MYLASLCQLLVIGALAPACSPGSAPVSQSPHDPSNPAAAEGSPPGAATPEGAHVDAGASKEPAATVYTCPMHPEVTSSSPGKCPKCGMTLVPKK